MWCSLLYADLKYSVPALAAACRDAILAVRVQAAGSLAAVADSLRCISETSTAGEDGVDVELAIALFPVALRLADDHDKVRADGVRALGVLLTLLDKENAAREKDVESSVDAVLRCLGCANVKVQWSACLAAGMVCKISCCGAGVAEENRTALVIALEELAKSSENGRTRDLAGGVVLEVAPRAAHWPPREGNR